MCLNVTISFAGFHVQDSSIKINFGFEKLEKIASQYDLIHRIIDNTCFERKTILSQKKRNFNLAKHFERCASNCASLLVYIPLNQL